MSMSAGRGLRRVTQCTSILSKSSARTHLSAVPRSYIIHRRRDGFPPQNIRCYSTQTDDRDGSHGHQNDELSEEPVDLSLEEQMLAFQNESIAELEQQLGKSLEQAVLQDGLADRLNLELIYEAEHNDLEPSIEEKGQIQLIELELLRFQKSTPEEIARQARSMFGDYLPEKALNPEELVIYRRLYGEPIFNKEDVDESRDFDQPQSNALLDIDGSEIKYHLENEEEIINNMAGKTNFAPQGDNAMGTPIDQALTDGNRAAEVAMALEGEVLDEDHEVEDEDDDIDDTRSHPLTGLGRFASSPRTKFFSQDKFVRPIDKVMSDFSNKQLKDMCERTFGGPGLPDSAFTPRSGRARQQVPIPLGASQQNMGQMEANAFVTTVMPPTYASISAVLVETRKRLGSSWLTKLLATQGGPRILDAGSGGVGVLAWQEIVQAHWDNLYSSDSHRPPPPRSKPVVLTGSDTLRSRAAKLLENTTFVPRLPDYVNVRQTPTMDDDRPVQQRKQFDVIISSHALFPLKEEWERKQHVQNLWSLLSDDGGVLILIEKGIPRGFEAVAGARDMILERYIAVPEGQKTAYSEEAQNSPAEKEAHQKVPGMIVAPCTNHDRCPLYKNTGISKGRKDVCSFQQRYIRPPFLQRILGAKDRNHDDADFSYVAIMKGEDLRTRTFSTWNHVQDPLSAPSAPESQTTTDTQQIAISEIQQGFEYYDPTVPDAAPPPPTHVLPRIMNAPIKRRGHVTIDICTPQAEIRRWTIPKSFSRQAYRDARKARWGDLWALGAKTSIVRNLKVGTPMKEYLKGEGMADPEVAKKPRSRKARLEAQLDRAVKAEEEMRSEEELEEEELLRMIEEQNLLDEDEDDGTIDMDTLLPRKKANRKSVASPASAPNTKSKQTSTSKETRKLNLAAQVLADDPIEYMPGRIGQDDPLTAWAEDLESVRLEEEATRRLNKSGRRASARNTQRLKRDLRRAAREGRRDDDLY